MYIFQFIRILLLTIVLSLYLTAIGQTDSPNKQNKHQEKFEAESVRQLLDSAITVELNNPERSLLLADKAREIAEIIHFDSAELKSMILMSSLQCRLMNLVEAINLGNQIIAKAEEMGSEIDVAQGREAVAVAYALGGSFDKSSVLYFENLKLYEKLDREDLIGRTLGNIGADFIEQRSYQKAIEYTSRALEIGLKTKNWTLVSDQYNNLAAIYQIGFPDNNKALYNYHQALQIAIRIKDVPQQGITQLNIGRLYAKTNQYDSAFICFNSSLDIFKKLNDKIHTADSYNALGDLHLTLNHLEKASEFGLASLAIAQEEDNLQTIYYSSTLLHNSYLKANDTINAYKYYTLQVKASDSLNRLQDQNELFRLEFQYTQEKILKEQRIKQINSYYILGIIILGLLSAMSIVLLFYTRQKIKARNALIEQEKVKSILTFKNKELSINLMALLKKNELIADISNKLAKLQDLKLETDLGEMVKKINHEIKLSSDDRLWQEFSVRFSETNREFYDKLLAMYPDLTPSELKLCAYLRLNMSSKEISELTGQRTETLEKARYRLRKKFGLNNSEVNLITFLSQV